MHVNMQCWAADAAFDTRKCHNAFAARDAFAVIPPRKNPKPWMPASHGLQANHCRPVDTPGAMARNEAICSSKYLGRSLWRRSTRYRRQSRAETKVHCLKLMGQRLAASDFDRQVAEVKICAVIINGITAVGIPNTIAVG